jgi:hypothetical protein
MKKFTTQIFSPNLNINNKTMLILPPLYDYNEFEKALVKVISDLTTDTFYSLDFYMFINHGFDFLDHYTLLPSLDKTYPNDTTVSVKSTELLSCIEAVCLTKGYMKVDTFVFAHQYLNSIQKFVDDIYHELDTNISKVYYVNGEKPASEKSIDEARMDVRRHTVLIVKKEAVI